MMPRDQGWYGPDFPDRLERLGVCFKRRGGPQAGAASAQRTVGDGLEFSDHRSYSPGDDIRFVDWKSYARLQKLWLRTFHRHSESPLEIWLDRSASMYPGEDRRVFDAARRAAAVWAYLAMAQGRRVTLTPFSDHLQEPLSFGRNRNAFGQVLSSLGRLRSEGKSDLLACAEAFATQATRPGELLLISDLTHTREPFEASLSLLRKRVGQVTVFQVFSPQPAIPAGASSAIFIDAETHETMEVVLTDARVAEYLERRRWYRAEIRECCLRQGVAYLALPEQEPFEAWLNRLAEPSKPYA